MSFKLNGITLRSPETGDSLSLDTMVLFQENLLADQIAVNEANAPIVKVYSVSFALMRCNTAQWTSLYNFMTAYVGQTVTIEDHTGETYTGFVSSPFSIRKFKTTRQVQFEYTRIIPVSQQETTLVIPPPSEPPVIPPVTGSEQGQTVIVPEKVLLYVNFNDETVRDLCTKRTPIACHESSGPIFETAGVRFNKNWHMYTEHDDFILGTADWHFTFDFKSSPHPSGDFSGGYIHFLGTTEWSFRLKNNNTMSFFVGSIELNTVVNIVDNVPHQIRIARTGTTWTLFVDGVRKTFGTQAISLVAKSIQLGTVEGYNSMTTAWIDRVVWMKETMVNPLGYTKILVDNEFPLLSYHHIDTGNANFFLDFNDQDENLVDQISGITRIPGYNTPFTVDWDDDNFTGKALKLTTSLRAPNYANSIFQPGTADFYISYFAKVASGAIRPFAIACTSTEYGLNPYHVIYSPSSSAISCRDLIPAEAQNFNFPRSIADEWHHVVVARVGHFHVMLVDGICRSMEYRTILFDIVTGPNAVIGGERIGSLSDSNMSLNRLAYGRSTFRDYQGCMVPPSDRLDYGDAGTTTDPTQGDSEIPDLVVITPTNAPIIIQHPQPVTQLTGPVQFSVTVNGALPLTYTWQRKIPLGNWINLGAADSAVLTIETPTGYDNGSEFRCQVSNSVGTVASDSALLTLTGILGVNIPPAITVQPMPQSKIVGETATFSVQVASMDTYTVQWYKDGVAIEGATSTTLNLTNVQTEVTGSLYYCTVSTKNFTVTSDAAQLTVIGEIPVFLIQPSDCIVAFNSTIILTSLASCSGSFDYQWQKYVNNVWEDIIGETSATYYKQYARLEDSGIYRCRAYNLFGEDFTEEAEVTVSSLTQTTYILVQPQSQSVIVREQANFEVIVVGSATYQWLENDAPISGATSSVYAPFVTLEMHNKVYKCLINGQLESTSAILTVLEDLNNPASELTDPFINTGNAITNIPLLERNVFIDRIGRARVTTLSGQLPALYTWAKNTFVDLLNTSPYAEVLGNSFSPLVDLTCNIANIYNATPTSQTFRFYSVPLPVLPNALGAYYLISDFGSSIVPNIPRLNGVWFLTATIWYNFGIADRRTFTNTISYQWQRSTDGITWSDIGGATSFYHQYVRTGSYYYVRCKVIVDGTTMYTAIARVDQSTSNYIWLAPFKGTMDKLIYGVVGNDATITVEAYNATSYQWYEIFGKWKSSLKGDFTVDEKDVKLIGETSDTLVIHNLSAKDDGRMFGCVLTNASGSELSKLHVIRLPTDVEALTAPVIDEQPVDTTVATTAAAKMRIKVSGQQNITFLWQEYIGGVWTPIEDATTYYYAITRTTPLDDGRQFRCIVSNEYGDVISDTATVTVTYSNTAPVITYHPADKTVYASQYAGFRVEHTSDLAVTFQWQEWNGASWDDLVGETDSFYIHGPAEVAKTFRCAVTNSVDTTYSNEADLTIDPIPEPAITDQSIDKTIDRDAVDTLFVTASGATPLTYAWRKVGSATAYFTTPTMQIPNNSLGTFKWQCTVTNQWGRVFSNVITVTIQEKSADPMIITHPVSVYVYEGAIAVFPWSFSMPRGGTKELYISKDGGMTWGLFGDPGYDIGSFTNGVWSVTAAVAYNGYQIKYKLTDVTNVIVWSNVATLNVTAAPSATIPVVANILAEANLSVGGTILQSIAATGLGLTYEWQWSYDLLTWTADGTDYYKYVQARQLGITFWRVKVTNSAGSVYSNTALIKGV